MATPTTSNHYNHTAWFYEQLSGVYSLGKIQKSKLAEIPLLNRGDRVLYAGVGGGQDAVYAASKGCQVTCVDLAPAMIDRARRKLDAVGAEAELIAGDIMEHDRAGEYDAVCANYFLNVFNPSVMTGVLDHLVAQVRPGGLFMVADFTAPTGSGLAKLMHSAYYWTANATFTLLTRTPIHEVYDYVALTEERGLKHKDTIKHPLFSGGPEYFETIVMEKPAEG